MRNSGCLTTHHTTVADTIYGLAVPPDFYNWGCEKPETRLRDSLNCHAHFAYNGRQLLNLNDLCAGKLLQQPCQFTSMVQIDNCCCGVVLTRRLWADIMIIDRQIGNGHGKG